MAKSRKNIGFYIYEDNNVDAVGIEDRNDITLGELAEGYIDNSENIEGGVFGWNGNLNIRPKFQRAYVVENNEEWKAALARSVVNGQPIGTIYFGVAEGGKKYINIDGQQRLMTLLSFLNGQDTLKMMVDGKDKDVMFEELSDKMQRRFKQYRPSIKICSGTEKALLEWFKTINQPTTVLTAQELRNAAFNGMWCEHIKMYFSKVKASASATEHNADFLYKGGDYNYADFSLNLDPTRQDVLEMALDWASMQVFGVDTDLTKEERIESYMAMYADPQTSVNVEDNGTDLVNRYKAVIDWARKTFHSEYLEQKCAKNVNWGRLYATYGENEYDIEKLNADADRYFMDEEVTANSAVFEYVLMGCPTDKRNMLVLRAFTTPDKAKMYKMQGGIDPIDGKKYKIEEMDAHHIIAWENGGKTELSNGVLISKANHKKVLHAELTYNAEQIRQMRDELLERVKSSKK